MASTAQETTKAAPIELNEEGPVLPKVPLAGALPISSTKPEDLVDRKYFFRSAWVSLLLLSCCMTALLCFRLNGTSENTPALGAFPSNCVEKDALDPARALLLKRVSHLENQLFSHKGYFDWLKQQKQVPVESARKEVVHLRVRLGDMNWMLRQRSCAEAHYRRALAIEKHQPDETYKYSAQAVHAQLRVGILQYEQGRLLDAKKILEDMLSEMQLDRENRPPALQQLANTLRDLGEVESAVLLYRQAAAEREAPSASLQVDMGQALVLQGKTEEASSVIHNAFMLAEQKLRQEDVVRTSNEERVVDDETAELYTSLGAAFSLIGRTSHAKKALEKALEILRRGGGHQRNPAAVGETLRLLARTHRDEGEQGEALKVAENALKLHERLPQNPDHVEELAAVYIAAADIIREVGNTTRAQWLAERALQLVSTVEDAHSGIKVSAHKVLGQVAHDLGLLDIAGEHYEEALELLTDNGNPLELADSHNLLGTVLQDSNELTAASRHYRMALKYQNQGRGEASVDAMAVTNNLATILVRVGEACQNGELDQAYCQPARRHVAEAVQLFEHAEGLGGQAALPERNPELLAIKENLEIAREVLQNFDRKSHNTL